MISEYWTTVFKTAVANYLKTAPQYTIKNYDHEYFWPFRASGIGHCLMATYIEFQQRQKGHKPNFSAQQMLVFQQGHWFEHILLEALKMAGLLTNQDMEVALTIDGVLVPGHVDGEIGEFILEVKTAGASSFDKVLREQHALHAHELQTAIYARGWKREKILYCYFGKAKNDLAVFQQEVSPAHFLEVENRVTVLHKALQSQVAPPPEHSFLCKAHCEWRDFCYKMTGDPVPAGYKPITRGNPHRLLRQQRRNGA